jgi:hypothetical protein
MSHCHSELLTGHPSVLWSQWMKALRSRLNGLIDDYTDQICMLTHSYCDTAPAPFQEIKNEPDTYSKLAKLLHLATHEISAAQVSTTQAHSSDFALLISSVRAHWTDAPILTDSFIDWLPRKIAASRKRLSAAKSELATQRKRNDILQTQVNRDRSLHRDSESETDEISRMRAQMKQFEAKISALKKRVSEQGRSDGIVEDTNLSRKAEGASDVMQKYEELLELNCRLKEEMQILEEKCDVLMAARKTGADENSRLKAKISELEQASKQLSRARIEREVLRTKLTDTCNRNLVLKTDCQTAIQRSDQVIRQRIASEAKLAKLKDQTTGLTARFGLLDEEALNFQRFAFLLADALGENFDPKLGEQELQRLILIARKCRVAVGEGYSRLDRSGMIANEFDRLERDFVA